MIRGPLRLAVGAVLLALVLAACPRTDTAVPGPAPATTPAPATSTGAPTWP